MLNWLVRNRTAWSFNFEYLQSVFTNHIFNINVIRVLALNNQQCLICHKTKQSLNRYSFGCFSNSLSNPLKKNLRFFFSKTNFSTNDFSLDDNMKLKQEYLKYKHHERNIRISLIAIVNLSLTLSLSLYIYVCMCVCKCMYIYTHTHIYIYRERDIPIRLITFVHLYIHIYIYIERER